MKSIILFFFAIFISCHSKSQDKLDFSKKNISYTERDHETDWIRTRLKNPDKWGYIDKDSLVMIPFEYDFLNPFKDGVAYAKNNNKEFFITKKNVRLKGDFEAVGIFSEGLAPVKKNGEWGFIDNQANVVIPIQYDKVDCFRSSGLCAVTKNGKSGFINKVGREIIPVIYDEASQEMKDQNVIVKKNNKWAVFDNSGKQLSDFIYDSFKRAYISDFSKDVFTRDESTFFENGAALVEIGGKYKFINAKAQAAFPNNTFDSASVFDTFKNAIVKKKGKFGMIKTDGTFKVPLEYDFINYFESNHAFSEYYNARKGKIYSFFNKDLKKIGESYEAVYNDFSNSDPTLIYKNLKRKYGIVDWQGNVIVPFEYDELRQIENTTFLWVKKGNFYGVISEKGQIKIPIKYKEITSVYDKFDNNEDVSKFLFITNGMVIDINNNIVIKGYNSLSPLFYNHNKLIASKNKKFGIIDISKKVLLPLEYDEISNWVEYGPEKRQFIEKNGKHGLIEFETFKIIIPPIYDQFISRENLIFASKNGKAGILDINNKELCPFIFDQIRPHKYFGYDGGQHTMFYSKNGNVHFQINLEGKILKEISEKEYKNYTEHQNK
ncbi:WG repeat-containing protein [Chryseobacterium sp. OSA05B]|uniref:WG repeat-containing protein n=1 Tax=Chryseobacterium sp. OSA05B TaxID=2862650 RepID=UPI001CBC054D|nr:WG repeat-containing protein [Chryseobacterium sp. OSA05B]